MAEPGSSAPASPLAGRRIAEVLATSTGGVGTHLRSVLPALMDAGADIRVCGPRATDELFAFSATGARFSAVEISAALNPLADIRAALPPQATSARSRSRREGQGSPGAA